MLEYSPKTLRILTHPVRFLRILATDLQSMSLKRRYSIFTIDHARCSTASSASAHTTPITQSLNYENENWFFGCSAYLAENTASYQSRREI